MNRPAYVKFNYSGDPLILAGKMNVKSVDVFCPINSVQTCSAHEQMRVFVCRVGYFVLSTVVACMDESWEHLRVTFVVLTSVLPKILGDGAVLSGK